VGHTYNNVELLVRCRIIYRTHLIFFKRYEFEKLSTIIKKLYHGVVFKQRDMLITIMCGVVGPITFINDEYNGSLPNLALRPHSWTKVA
jgi:hypothetical protein